MLEEVVKTKLRIAKRLKIEAQSVSIVGSATVDMGGSCFVQDYVVREDSQSQLITGTEKETFMPGISGGSTGGGADTGLSSADTDPETINISEYSES